jgi:hypothetical protein
VACGATAKHHGTCRLPVTQQPRCHLCCQAQPQPRAQLPYQAAIRLKKKSPPAASGVRTAYLSHSSPVATSAARHRRSPGHSCPTRLLPSERQLLCQVGSMKFFLLSRVTLKVKGRGKAGAHEGLVDNNEFMRQLLCQVGPN